MGKFYELQPDIFAKYVPQLSSEIDDDISFIEGTILSQQFPTPLIFSTRHSSKEPPKGMHGQEIPIMSDLFITTLQKAGISNLQCFPVEIRSSTDGSIWKNYKAVNIVGLISAADLDKSEYTPIIDRPGENAIPLVAFEKLKINTSRTSGSLLFILAEEPGTIIVAESVVEFLRNQKKDEEWGITIDEC